ncbi:hypothetical protein EQV97_24910 [Pseudomonas sp. TMW22090]|nr:hypothetical protein [Pseudomonas sp. TMW22090]
MAGFFFASTVGASWLAMEFNDDAGSLSPCGILGFFASKLAPAGGIRWNGRVSCIEFSVVYCWV